MALALGDHPEGPVPDGRRRRPGPAARRPSPSPRREYVCHQVSSAPWRPLTTTSRAGRSARSWRVTAPLTSATRGRSVRTSTRPSRDPSTSTAPAVGHSRAPATCSSVVLPEPFGPRTTQRSPRSTCQSTPSSTARRRAGRVTPCSATTAGAADRVTRRDASTGREPPADAADQARAALRPGPLTGQPEPDLAPVAERRRARSSSSLMPAEASERQRDQSHGTRPSAALKTVFEVTALVDDGVGPAPRPAPSARRAGAARARRSRVNGGCRRAGGPCRRRCARAPRSR